MTNNENFDNLNTTIKRAVSNFKPPEMLTVTEWANKYRRLSAEISAEPGQWRTSRTPYLEEPMNAFTDPKIHRVVVVASSQVGKTEMLLNMLGYAIDIDPGPIMWVTPTQDNAEDFSKRRIAPMIRDTKPLKRKMGTSKSRNSNNTVTKKRYPGGMLTLTGSNSPTNLASVPCRYVFGDEIDRWAKDAGGEGDPWGLLEARTITFYNHKMVQVSTPTIKGQSAIERSFLLGTQEFWEVKCPHCSEYSYVEFDNIHFKYDKQVINGKKVYNVTETSYCCPSCGCSSSEQEIKKAPHKWVAKNPDAYNNGARSFWINAFSSPWMAWERIILRFLEADGDPEQLKTVFNTLLGQTWEDRGDLMSDEELINNRESYGAELPDKVLCLTCGVDTQDNRFEYEVVGHGYYRETWGIEKGIISGKPNSEDTWERLDQIIDKHWKYSDGKSLKISVTFIDSGGHYTQEVYEHCAERVNKRVFAIKGKGGEGIPFTGPPSKVNIVKENKVVGKTWLYVLGVDAGKERIMSALKVQSPGARYCHFSKDAEAGYDANFFNGLLSEKLIYKNNKWVWEKLPGHQRNEPLDCRNYAMAAFEVLKPNLEAIEKRLIEVRTTNIDIDVSKPKPKKVVKKKQRKRVRQESDW